jgi:hypothetical protein
MLAGTRAHRLAVGLLRPKASAVAKQMTEPVVIVLFTAHNGLRRARRLSDGKTWSRLPGESEGDFGRRISASAQGEIQQWVSHDRTADNHEEIK